MKMSLVVDGLLSDVTAVGELGDDTVAEVAERIAAVVARSLPSRILDLLSEVAGELLGELPEGRVDIRLVGDDVEFAYVDDDPATPESDAELTARITLRLSDQLKARVEESASRQGLSVNGWILRTLERGTSASTHQSRPGRLAPARLRERVEGREPTMEKTFATRGKVLVFVENEVGLIVITARDGDSTQVDARGRDAGAAEFVDAADRRVPGLPGP